MDHVQQHALQFLKAFLVFFRYEKENEESDFKNIRLYPGPYKNTGEEVYGY